MSRRKRRSPARDRPGHNDAAPADRPSRQPDPPRPNKWFLLATIGLLAAWTALLLVMAMAD